MPRFKLHVGRDKTPPSVPTNLVATAVSASQVNLSWDASTDASGIRDYRVYRNSVHIQTLSGTSYSDTGLSASTTYTYTVVAVDNANNASAPSSSAQATTQAATTGFDYYISTTGSDSNPGTLASPWAITALNDAAKRALYAGKRVGLLNGTYALADRPGVWRQVPCIEVAAGTAGSPTIIEAASARAATLDLGTATRLDRPAIGQESSSLGAGGYVHIRNITVVGGSYCGVAFNSSTAHSIAGVVIEGCHIHGINRAATATPSDNCPPVWLQGATGAIVRNCYLHDVVNSGTANATCVQMYGCLNTVIEYNTMANAWTAVYDKGLVAAVPNEGCVVRYNFCYNTKRVFHGFDNGQQSSGPRLAFHIHNNVVVCPGGDTIAIFNADLHNGHNIQSPAHFYNNTVSVIGDVSNGAFALHPNTSAKVWFYNNILRRTGSAGWLRDLHSGTGAFDTLNHNCYPTNSPQWSLEDGGSEQLRTSLATWQSLTGLDANSITADPLFVNVSGTTAADFQLQAGSPCKALGAGSTEIGAWAGQTQIGVDW